MESIIPYASHLPGAIAFYEKKRIHLMQFICYPKCTTCQKAKKWLEDNGIPFDERHIKENNPTGEELRAWHKQSNLPLKKFFNTSGLQYSLY